MSLMAGGSSDSISVFGLSSPVTTIMGQAGNDLVHVMSTYGPATTKTLNIQGGEDEDSILVYSTNADTTTNLFGQSGNDNLTIGSSFGDNNGNLDKLRGALFASGGGGMDRLYINDVGKTSSFSYLVGPTSVANNGSASNSFAGLSYDNSVEMLRLDATNFDNDVLVTPSFDTNFSFFGNGGFNTLEITGDPDEDGRRFFGDNGGVGFWTFTNGLRDIFFSNFFNA